MMTMGVIYMGHDRPDATHRLRWHVMPERSMPQQDSLRIVPADMASWDDIQAVFGVRGQAASCRCQWYKTAPRTWDGQTAALAVDERARQLRVQTAADHPESPVTNGLVAYMDGEPAGWVAVEPRTAYPRLQRKRLVWKDRPWGELFVGKDTVLAEAGFRDVTHPSPRRSVMRVDFA